MSYIELVFGSTALFALLLTMFLINEIQKNLLNIENYEVEKRLEREQNKRAFLTLTSTTLIISISIALGNHSRVWGLDNAILRNMGEVGGFFYLGGVIYFLQKFRSGTS